MQEQQNTQLIKDFYAAFTRGDIATVISYMAPQVDWELAAVPGISFSGKRKGREQVAEVLRMADEKRAVSVFSPREFIAQGKRVLVLGHSLWTVRDSGREFESDWVHVFTVEDGQVAAFREFLDSHLAIEAFQCDMRAAGTPAAAAPALN